MNDERLALAKELGATHAFNAKDDAVAKIRELVPQGLGYALDTTGINAVIQDAWGLLGAQGDLRHRRRQRPGRQPHLQRKPPSWAEGGL